MAAHESLGTSHRNGANNGANTHIHASTQAASTSEAGTQQGGSLQRGTLQRGSRRQFLRNTALASSAVLGLGSLRNAGHMPSLPFLRAPDTGLEHLSLNSLVEHFLEQNLVLAKKLRHPDTGLFADRIHLRKGLSHEASSASAGFAIAYLAHLAEDRPRLLSPEKARELITPALRFYAHECEQYKGWFPHFLNLDTGAPTAHTEWSTIDTALLVLGALSAGSVLGGEVENLARHIAGRLDFHACLHKTPHMPGPLFSHGWRKDEKGNFHIIPHCWDTPSEGIMLYALAGMLGKGELAHETWKLVDKRLESLAHPSLFIGFFPLAFFPANLRFAGMPSLGEHAQHILNLQKQVAQERQQAVFGYSACYHPDDSQYLGNPIESAEVIAPPAVLAYKDIDPHFVEQQFLEWKARGLIDMTSEGKAKFLGVRGSALSSDPSQQSSYFLGIDYLSTALVLLGRTSRIVLSEADRESFRGMLEGEEIVRK